MKETQRNSQLAKEIRKVRPGAHVSLTSSPFRSGFPDIQVLYVDGWSLVEGKRAKDLPSAWAQCTAVQKETLIRLANLAERSDDCRVYLVAYLPTGGASLGHVWPDGTVTPVVASPNRPLSSVAEWI